MSTFRSPTVRRCGSTRPRTPAIARGTTDRRVTVNGGTGSVMRIVEHLRRQGHQALVVAPDEGPDEHDGVRVVRVPAVSIPGAAVPPVGLPTWRLQKVMAEFAPEVVHLAYPIVLGAGGLAAARRMIIGHVGRLAPEKHVERLAALDDLPGVRVVVVGDGPERSHLQRGLPQAVFSRDADRATSSPGPTRPSTCSPTPGRSRPSVRSCRRPWLRVFRSSHRMWVDPASWSGTDGPATSSHPGSRTRCVRPSSPCETTRCYRMLATFPSRDSERRQLAASCSSSGVIWPKRSPGA